MTGVDDTSAPRRVVLMDLPVELFVRAQQHHEELKREFALIEHPEADADHHLPGRLLALGATLQERFAAFTTQQNQQVADAAARGVATIDLEFRLPAAAGPAAAEFGRLLDEADEFCRGGELLTLASPEDLAAFRRWYLNEFVRQVDGKAPTPWRAPALR